jgi:sensor c-di-GMP phosphodiesterase-like protein
LFVSIAADPAARTKRTLLFRQTDFIPITEGFPPVPRQPFPLFLHRIAMQIRDAILLLISPVLIAAGACNNQSPEQIRKQTAEETATMKRDTKAVAEGIKEGLADKKSIDLNRASRDELTTLPGIDAHRADRIIAERPYADTHQLVSRHLLSEDEYAQIQSQVTANP